MLNRKRMKFKPFATSAHAYIQCDGKNTFVNYKHERKTKTKTKQTIKHG